MSRNRFFMDEIGGVEKIHHRKHQKTEEARRRLQKKQASKVRRQERRIKAALCSEIS